MEGNTQMLVSEVIQERVDKAIFHLQDPDVSNPHIQQLSRPWRAWLYDSFGPRWSPYSLKPDINLGLWNTGRTFRSAQWDTDSYKWMPREDDTFLGPDQVTQPHVARVLLATITTMPLLQLAAHLFPGDNRAAFALYVANEIMQGGASLELGWAVYSYMLPYNGHWMSDDNCINFTKRTHLCFDPQEHDIQFWLNRVPGLKLLVPSAEIDSEVGSNQSAIDGAQVETVNAGLGVLRVVLEDEAFGVDFLRQHCDFDVTSVAADSSIYAPEFDHFWYDLELSVSDWEPALVCSYAYRFYCDTHREPDAEKDFWLWWLREAIPAAVKATGLHAREYVQIEK